MLVPLGEPRVENGGVRNEHRLIMVGGCQYGFPRESQDDARPPTAEDFGEHHAGIEAVEEPPVRQAERFAMRYAEDLGGPPRLDQAHFGTRRTRRRFSIRQIDDADAVALPRQPSQCAAAGDLHIIRMGADGDHVQRFG